MNFVCEINSFGGGGGGSGGGGTMAVWGITSYYKLTFYFLELVASTLYNKSHNLTA